MIELEATLQSVIAETGGVIGIAVVEVESRQLVSFVQNQTDFSPATLEALAVSAVEMIRGKAVTAVESLLSSTQQKKVQHSIEEICINAQDVRIFVATIHDKPGFILVLGTDISLGMGMGWILVRRSMALIAEKLP